MIILIVIGCNNYIGFLYQLAVECQFTECTQIYFWSHLVVHIYLGWMTCGHILLDPLGLPGCLSCFIGQLTAITSHSNQKLVNTHGCIDGNLSP